MLNRAVLFTKKIEGYKFGNNVDRIELRVTFGTRGENPDRFTSSFAACRRILLCLASLCTVAPLDAMHDDGNKTTALATGRTKRTEPVKKRERARRKKKIAGAIVTGGVCRFQRRPGTR